MSLEHDARAAKNDGQFVETTKIVESIITRNPVINTNGSVKHITNVMTPTRNSGSLVSFLGQSKQA
jgi:hypothetical protein